MEPPDAIDPHGSVGLHHTAPRVPGAMVPSAARTHSGVQQYAVPSAFEAVIDSAIFLAFIDILDPQDFLWLSVTSATVLSVAKSFRFRAFFALLYVPGKRTLRTKAEILTLMVEPIRFREKFILPPQEAASGGRQ